MPLGAITLQESEGGTMKIWKAGLAGTIRFAKRLAADMNLKSISQASPHLPPTNVLYGMHCLCQGM